MPRSIEAIRRAIDRRFGSGKIELPPLPEVAQAVLAKASDPLAAASDLAALIHRDQGLATEILHDANTAHQAGRIAIVSLQQSTARLGVQRVVEIAVAASIRDSVFCARGFEAEQRLLWRRSLATALYAKEVARLLREDVETVFLCGLFVRVGTALLIRALAELRKPGDPKLSLEEFFELDADFRVRLGVDATEQWGLPESVRDSVEATENTGDAQLSTCTQVVILAERLVELLENPDEAKEEALTEDPLLDSLGIYPEDLDVLIALRDTIGKSLDRRN